ncbi:MAG: DUF3810 domain-containing protein [Sphingobacteriales bacterium]|nr:MAG: DUF3810 domain-containing protein [Sphingobacteriales bacterium]
MFTFKKYRLTIFLLVIAAAIHVYSVDSERVENSYSQVIFPFISLLQRSFLGWIPFSIGDILYSALIIYFIYRLIKYFKNRKRMPLQWKKGILKGLNFLLLVYISFNIFWGLNYNRAGVLVKLNIRDTTYSEKELLMLNEFLVRQVNASKHEWINEGKSYPGNKEMFEMVERSYSVASEKYNFLKYKPSSIKPSLWSIAGNYLGFTGYYNPFTGEGQVNTTTPNFLHPFTACHEVAHQIGYAKEMEANFVGALAAMHSSEPLVRYSVYLDLFFYANRNLYLSDSSTAKKLRDKLTVPVKKDIDEWRRFQLEHRSFFEPLFRWAYGKFLERNQQPQGIMAYDEVTAFIIAYYKKEGILNP